MKPAEPRYPQIADSPWLCLDFLSMNHKLNQWQRATQRLTPTMNVSDCYKTMDTASIFFLSYKDWMTRCNDRLTPSSHSYPPRGDLEGHSHTLATESASPQSMFLSHVSHYRGLLAKTAQQCPDSSAFWGKSYPPNHQWDLCQGYGRGFPQVFELWSLYRGCVGCGWVVSFSIIWALYRHPTSTMSLRQM